MNKYLSEQSTNTDTISIDYPQLHINLAGTNPFIHISPNYIHVSLINNTTNILTYNVNNSLPIQYVATDIFIISKYNIISSEITRNSNVNNVNGELIIKHSIKSTNSRNYPPTIFSGFFLQDGDGNHANETSIDKIIKTFSNSSLSTTIDLNNDVDKSSPYICANLKNSIPTMILFINPIQLKNNIVISSKTTYDNANNTLFLTRLTDSIVRNDANINNIYIENGSTKYVKHVIENFTEGNQNNQSPIDVNTSYITCYPVDDTNNSPLQNVYTVIGTGKTLNNLYASNTMNLISYFFLFLIILFFELFAVPFAFKGLINYLNADTPGTGTGTDVTGKGIGTVKSINSVITYGSIILILIIIVFLVLGYVLKSIKLTISGIMAIIVYIMTFFILFNNWNTITNQLVRYQNSSFPFPGFTIVSELSK